MICLKDPEVGARFAGGACAAPAVESASTIATNTTSLVFIVVPRSVRQRLHGRVTARPRAIDRFEHPPLMVSARTSRCSATRDRMTPHSTPRQKSAPTVSHVSLAVCGDKFNYTICAGRLRSASDHYHRL